MKKVRIGMVGLGFMGTTHFRIYHALKNAEVAAISDVDPAKRAGDIRKVIGNIGNEVNTWLNLEGINAYPAVSDMIKDPSIDVIDICVPTSEHQKIAIEALKNGKHVFCEKPVCRNLSELAELADTVRNSGRFFNVGMCVRAWPEYYHVWNLYKEGKLGRIRTAFFRRLSPDVNGNSWNNWFLDAKISGGALLDLHLHDTDFIRFMFGRPQAVTSFGINSLRSNGGTDYVITNYHFEDCLIAAEGGWCANKKVAFEMSFQMVFDHATVRLAEEGYRIYWEHGEVEVPQVGDSNLPTGWHQELAYFLDCIEQNIPPNKYQTLDEIVDSFKIVMAEQESVDRGKTVFIQY